MERQDLKVLIVNKNDISGGAARAAYSLHRSLIDAGIDSQMLVQVKDSNDDTVIGPEYGFMKWWGRFKPSLDKLPVYLYPKREKRIFSNAILPSLTIQKINQTKPDIVNLHWIGGGFLRIEDIAKIKAPIVWTLHDSWAFTGGCHLPYNCKGYQNSCGNCPQLNSHKENDLSRINWKRKNKAFKSKEDLIITTPSRWLRNCCKISSLLKDRDVSVVPNIIKLDEFKNLSKKNSRLKLKLDPKKKYILFGAMASTTDKNKGFDLLLKSLEDLEFSDNLELLVFGNDKDLKIKTNFPVRFFGVITDHRILNALYSASDLTIVPSRSESFSLVSAESFSSGTPAIAFEIGGIPDIIDHKKNGYLAKPFDVDDLANGIKWCLESDERIEKLSKSARKRAVNKFDSKLISAQVIELYKKVLATRNK